MIDPLGWILSTVAHVDPITRALFAALGMFCLWIVLSVKAWQGERFELPVFGTLASKLS